jgi:hypothetical protein
VLIFQLVCRACLFFHDTTLLDRGTGSNDNYHQISAKPVSGRSEIFVCDHVLAFVMLIFIAFGRLSFLSCVPSITRRNSRRNSGSPDPAIQRRNCGDGCWAAVYS